MTNKEFEKYEEACNNRLFDEAMIQAAQFDGKKVVGMRKVEFPQQYIVSVNITYFNLNEENMNELAEKLAKDIQEVIDRHDEKGQVVSIAWDK